MPSTPRSLPSLPFHLTMQGMLSATSNAALLQARLASQSSNASWPHFAGAHPLQIDHPELERAINLALKEQHRQLLEGVHNYLNHPYTRPEPQADVCWQEGDSRLLDYGVPEGVAERAAMLVSPSLINRHYILDLMEGRSLVHHLRNQGIRVFMMDWGNPTAAETGFTLTHYIDRLHRAFAILRQSSTAPAFLSGYCMGGLLALALAQRIESELAGLALLAMPWDFHAHGFPRVPLDTLRQDKLEAILSHAPTLSGDIIQTLFYAANPWVFARKFAGFPQLDEQNAIEFVAIESWVNDNVDMTAEVARECLIGWVQQNKPVRGAWLVGGEPVLPDALSLPVFAACPTQDTIVPPASAEAILAALPHATVCRPLSGHVGMVAGPRAHKELWKPLSQWTESLLSR